MDITIERYYSHCKIHGNVPIQAIMDKTAQKNRGLADYQKKKRGWTDSIDETSILMQLWKLNQNQQDVVKLHDKTMTKEEAKQLLSVKSQDRLLNILMSSEDEISSNISRSIDDTFCLFDHILMEFPSGLLQEIEQVVKGCSSGFEIIDKRIKPTKQFNWNLKDIKLRPPQAHFLEQIKVEEHGAFEWTTGTGKTLAYAIATTTHCVKTLIIAATGVDLVRQTRDKFLEYTDIPSEQIGICLGGQTDLKPVTVTTPQTLENNLQAFIDFGFDQLIVDEAHYAGTKGLYEAIMSIPSYYRYFGSGTLYRVGHPQRKPGSLDLVGENALLKALCMKILDYRSYQDGVKAGYLAPAHVECVDSPPDLGGVGYKVARDKGIIYNRSRNKAFAQAIKKETDTGKTVLALVVEKDHAQEFMNVLIKNDIKAKLYTSDTSALEREDIIQSIVHRQTQVIIGTSCIRHGIDIPTLDIVANVGGLRSTRSTVQGTGRGVRKGDLVEDGVLIYSKQVAKIIDCLDKHHAQLHTHAMERMRVYVEAGFDVPHLKEVLEEERLLAKGRKEFFKAQVKRKRLSRVKSLPELKKQRDSLIIALSDPESHEAKTNGLSIKSMKSRLEYLDREIDSLERLDFQV